MAASPPPAKPMNSLPDYAILFWHRISNWNSSNRTTHGVDPSSNASLGYSKVFGQYPLGIPSVPDKGNYYTPGRRTVEQINYVVRCVSDSENWPKLCDVRYAANTNLPESQQTLLFTGGAHGYNLVGRNKIPPLPNDYKQNPNDTLLKKNTSVYTYPHTGHTHTVKNVYKGVRDINPGSSKYLTQSNASYIAQSFGSFYVDPIFKDPKLSTKIITYIPKDIIVMYYGGSTLPSGYYDPYDINVTNSYEDQSANGYALPITFVQTRTDLERQKVGAININILKDYPYTKSKTIPQIFYLSGKRQINIPITVIENLVVGKKNANTFNFQISSEYSGYHDHKDSNVTKNMSRTSGVSYGVIAASGGARQYLEDSTSPTGPDTISHKHNVMYTCNMQLKSNRLKAYLSTNPYSPIVNGLIIGYSIGKVSGFSGPSSSGKNTLPKGWYFCDGENGTPDLRGRYPFLNFTQNDVTNGVFENSYSTVTITDIEVETINWQHGHAATDSPVAQPGAGGKIDVGSHSSFYDATSDSTNTTRHNHQASPADTIDGVELNATIGTTFDYEPPTTDIAFIMYNDTI